MGSDKCCFIYSTNVFGMLDFTLLINMLQVQRGIGNVIKWISKYKQLCICNKLQSTIN